MIFCLLTKNLTYLRKKQQNPNWVYFIQSPIHFDIFTVNDNFFYFSSFVSLFITAKVFFLRLTHIKVCLFFNLSIAPLNSNLTCSTCALFNCCVCHKVFVFTKYKRRVFWWEAILQLFSHHHLFQLFTEWKCVFSKTRSQAASMTITN